MSRFLDSLFPHWKATTKQTWKGVPSDEDEEENTAFLAHRTQSKHGNSSLAVNRKYSWPWIIATVIFACSTAVLVIGRQSTERCGLWRATDLEAVRPWISEHETIFYGALAYNDTGSLVREPSPGGKEWVGPPTPEMDALWDRVEAGSMVLLEGEESDMVRDKTTLFDGYWVTGLDVIHQMHCLNKVRKALYPESYQPGQSARTEMIHVEHCLDYIRQAIMCNADTTPVTHTWYATAQTFGPDFRTKHTCRDFDALLEWSLARTTETAKRKGVGREMARDPQSVVPGMLQGTGGMGHVGHAGHGSHSST